jgi:hypothetical protein
MSIERIPPFEESKNDKTEKGFRDALTMFTILENIKGRPEDFALVITSDKLLTKGLNHYAREFEAVLTIVPNLDEAIVHIDARVDTWYREQLRQRSERAKEMLGRYAKQIAEQVSQIRELNDFHMGIGTIAQLLGGSKTVQPGESIEKVNSLTFDRIESAVWKDDDKLASRILFRARCTASVTLSISPMPFYAPASKYLVGGGKQGFSSFLNSFSPKQEREKEISIRLYGEANLKRRNDEEWELVSMQVDKSLGQEETTELGLVPL